MRVLSRFFLLEEDIAKPSTRVRIERLARELIPDGRAGDFNQALMELGATVCTPKSTHCLTCPVMQHCAARLAGREHELPVKTKAKPPRPEQRLVALVEGNGEHAGCVLIRQRPGSGLLARLWELPHVLAAPPSAGATGEAVGGPLVGASAVTNASASAADMAALAAALADADGVALVPELWLMDAEHIFSHIRWDMRVYRCRERLEAAGRRPAALPAHYRWLAPGELERYAFPNVFLRILDAYWNRRA